ncbi:MAG: ATP-binding protein [Nitrolancea sp.]
MRSRLGRLGLQFELLVSYMAVLVATLAVVTLAMWQIAPSLFNRVLEHNVGRGRMAGQMTTAMQSATDHAFQTSLWQSLLVALAVGSLVAMAVSILVTRHIANPIRRIATVSAHIAHGEYAARTEVPATLEIGELAESLNRMAAELQTTEQRRIQLIGDVAHELRTPIATLQGYLEGLRDGVVEPSELLWSRLSDQTSRLNRLTEDLHVLFQVETGAASIERRAVSPGDLVRTATAALGPRFEEKQIDLELCLPPNAPQVLADRDRASQVLTNLLTNALRYTPPKGAVTVLVEPVGRFIWFRVADNGIGIPAEHVPHVFDRFYRVDPSRSRAEGGSGIGLSIARTLVEAQGGQIHAESAGSNLGSTFSFSLPAA